MIKSLFASGTDPNMTMGLYHLMGASPISYNEKTNTHLWNMWGQDYKFGDDARLAAVPLGKSPGGFWNTTFSIGAVGSTGLTLIDGFMRGGITGAASALVIEANVNKSLVKHAYTKVKNDGVVTYHPGRFSKPAEDFLKIGKFAPFKGNNFIAKGARSAVGGINFADFMARTVFGSMAGSSVGFAMGGGLAGTIGGTIAGGFATKHLWKLAGGAIAVGGARAIARGATTMLKHGYRHKQNQRAIHTSGSLAAFSTQGAYTMRQRAVQAMSKSHLNARSALGQEASLMHMPHKNYNSPYR